MLELGWTKEELRTAGADDVEGIWWGLFARHMSRSFEADLDQIEEELVDAQQKRSAKYLLGRAFTRLKRARSARRELRTLLLLDDEDD